MRLTLSLLVFALIIPLTASAHGGKIVQRGLTPIISETKLLKEVGIKVLTDDEQLGVGYAVVTPAEAARLSAKAHDYRRCGGFEALPASTLWTTSLANNLFAELHARNAKNARFANFAGIEHRQMIESALAQVDEQNLKNWVQWFSSYPTRFNKAPTANDHVNALKLKIEEMIKAAGAKFPVTVDLITHTSTPQKSIRVSITGSQRPSEIVVIGGHMDSINAEWLPPSKLAPGADDNASGSSNLLEALRIMLTGNQPQRTIEVMFYAGEESGLLGSAEIAQTYKQKKADVIGVLQLDMTLFAGDGEFTLGSMTDYTSPFLRNLLVEVNRLYVKANIIESKCGYGCSDHASWYRQGYPTLMPFESTMEKMNHNIHTKNDVINSTSNFRHSAMFAKIALAFAMELGNSTIREQ